MLFSELLDNFKSRIQKFPEDGVMELSASRSFISVDLANALPIDRA